MLIIPIVVLIFIGGSYALAVRFLPTPMVMKAVPGMAGAAFLGYYLAQFLFAVILRLIGVTIGGLTLLLLIAVSLLGAVGCAALVLRVFVRRHRRLKAEREAQSAVF
jgi:hypothetical protein